MPETLTATVANSVITDPSIRIAGADGFVIKYLDLWGGTFTHEQLTERVTDAGFAVTSPWRVRVLPDGGLVVEADVKRD